LLAGYGGDARIVAGGTALVLLMRQGLVQPTALLRLDTVSGLADVRDGPEDLRFGALVPLRMVAQSPLVRSKLPLLAGAAGLVGNVRVRNAATLGGNLCEADYASDLPAVLLALDARVRAQSPRGERELPVGELITDFFETTLAPDEVLSEVIVPCSATARGSYLKFVTRSSEDRPCVGAAALLAVSPDGRIETLRVAVGAVAGRPVRLAEVELGARDQAPTDELFRAIGGEYAGAVDPVSDARGSSPYRKQMIAVFVRRALAAARDGGPVACKV
jgi:carbon-monoxide dehydrogenase medium subunit